MIKAEKYPRAYNFVQAVREFEGKINQKELQHVRLVAEKFFAGEVQSLFIVLKDSPNNVPLGAGAGAGAGARRQVNEPSECGESLRVD